MSATGAAPKASLTIPGSVSNLVPLSSWNHNHSLSKKDGVDGFAFFCFSSGLRYGVVPAGVFVFFFVSCRPASAFSSRRLVPLEDAASNIHMCPSGSASEAGLFRT